MHLHQSPAVPFCTAGPYIDRFIRGHSAASQIPCAICLFGTVDMGTDKFLCFLLCHFSCPDLLIHYLNQPYDIFVDLCKHFSAKIREFISGSIIGQHKGAAYTDKQQNNSNNQQFEPHIHPEFSFPLKFRCVIINLSYLSYMTYIYFLWYTQCFICRFAENSFPPPHCPEIPDIIPGITVTAPKRGNPGFALRKKHFPLNLTVLNPTRRSGNAYMTTSDFTASETEFFEKIQFSIPVL